MQTLRRSFTLLGLAVLAFVAAGCHTMARRLEVAPVKKIIPGQTTITEVEKIFGPPHERITGSNGKTVARYYFGEPRLNNDVDPREQHDHPADLIVRTLTVSYGPGSVIERKLHDESVTAVRRYNARYIAGASVSPENLNFLQRNVTKKEELIDRLGEPTSTSFTSGGTSLLVWFSGSYRPNFVTDKGMRRFIVELDQDSRLKDFAVIENDLNFLWRMSQ